MGAEEAVEGVDEEEGEVGAMLGSLGESCASEYTSHITRHVPIHKSHVTWHAMTRACMANGPFKQVTRHNTRTNTPAHAAAADAAADADAGADASCSPSCDGGDMIIRSNGRYRLQLSHRASARVKEMTCVV